MPCDTAGLGSSPFARRYWGNRCYFLFLSVLRCFSSRRSPPLCEDEGIAPSGLPHSDICGSRCICHSPQLFAACHVLLRLREPRHPPCALSRSVNIFLTSRLNDMCLFALWLLVCETLLCFYSCLLTIQNLNLESLPALSLFSESEIRNRKVSDPYDLPTKQSRFRKPAPERRCSSRTFRYGYLVTT